jgi:hypothetical protein
MKLILSLILLLSLTACVTPQTTVTAGSAKPALAVQGAPVGAILYVDGLSMGSATQLNGNPQVLAVLEGAHTVEVRLGSAVLFQDKVFVGNGETHVIKVLPRAQP